MAIYRPDYKLIDAKKIVENLNDSEKNKSILYFIQHQQKIIDAQKEKIDEYKQFFEKLSKFIPSNNLHKLA